MSLPEAWVNRIFDRANDTWGHPFIARWEGMEPDKVKAAWGRDLACFAQHPTALWWALDHLPAKPLNAIEFRELVRQAPNQHFPQGSNMPRILEPMPAPAMNWDRVSEELEKLRADPAVRPGSNREWARVIVAKHRAGYARTRTVLQMAEECLGLR